MKNKILYSLQIARGIATLLVVIAHSTMFIDEHIFYGIFAIGRCGVDFFFVISGFIIYYTNQDLINNLPKLNQYLLRRLVRVYPVHWISLMIIVMILYYCIVNHLTMQSLKRSLIIKSFFLWPTYLEGMPINPVTWTLSHEVFFYIIFGVSVALGKRVSIAVFFFWFASALTSLTYSSQNAFLHMFTNTKNIEFIYGCLVAIYINKFQFTRRIYLTIFYSCVLLLIASWYFVWDRSFIEDGKLDFIFSGIPCALIIYSLVKLENNKLKNKLKYAFIFIGNASYSIYLNHFTLMAFLDYYFDKLAIGKIVMFISLNILCFLFGVFFYILIEKPLTKYLRKLVDRNFVVNRNSVLHNIDENVKPIAVKS